MFTSYADATAQEIDAVMEKATTTFAIYSQCTLKERANLLRTIAEALAGEAADIIALAQEDTHLEWDRLKTEFNRTLFQLNSYADACEEGTWLEARIDTADPQRQPPKPDLRKMLVPLGPVVVFGASNFPFAYATPGGDTACALAAGCPVIVKAHPAHAATSQKIAGIISKAVYKCSLPNGLFQHIHGASFETGKALVLHPLTRAVGFTGSQEGGRALYNLAAGRSQPIPVFAEMGSVNPVFLLPQKLETDAVHFARLYAQSITGSAGQFCTAPGLLIGIQSNGLQQFSKALVAALNAIVPVTMLHDGITKAFHAGRRQALAVKGVEVLTAVNDDIDETLSLPTLATTSAQNFLQYPQLHKEVFGPFAILVVCENESEITAVAQKLEGQLTTSLIATEAEFNKWSTLVQTLQQTCGRFIYNGVPTGVEVALAMHHGGPYPATTDSRFTAVGADGIKRFARPLCYQNWTDHFLPDALKNDNPLLIWRTVNNMLTKEGVS